MKKKEVMSNLWFSDFALEGAISKVNCHWCVKRQMNHEACTISKPWKYETKLNENMEVMTILWFSDFAIEGAISKGSGHWCI